VVSGPDGETLDEAAVRLGTTTNNVAEYRAVLLALDRARALGATAVDLVGDSELVANQLTGRYRVRSAALQPLHAQATRALAAFADWTIRTVPRSLNARADALVNAALDS
jgi:ribonuclease HI